jgi:hypothetical protein
VSVNPDPPTAAEEGERNVNVGAGGAVTLITSELEAEVPALMVVTVREPTEVRSEAGTVNDRAMGLTPLTVTPFPFTWTMVDEENPDPLIVVSVAGEFT